MKASWKHFEHDYLKPRLRKFEPWRNVIYGDIRVFYKRYLDGGGSTFGQDYISFLHDCGMPRQPRVFEWCAGPGFIGFSLLGYGLCDTLCLADINPDAVGACRRTIAANKLSDRVTVNRSDNLENIPELERWDLVVGNPPHFDLPPAGELRYADTGWSIHRRFFETVARHLKPEGVILIQENNRGSCVETFRAMIEQAGFSIVAVHNGEARITPYSRFYFLGIVRRGCTPPAWLVRPESRITPVSAPDSA